MTFLVPLLAVAALVGGKVMIVEHGVFTTRFYAGLHGEGTCVSKIIANEVSLRSTCVGTIAR